ncbi:MAG: efflux RND transporter permease subunit, partial [Pseudomonadota bacterium]
PIRARSPEPLIAVGPFATSIEDLKNIPIGRRYGKTIKLSDVAEIKMAYDEVISRVSFGDKHYSAVTATYTKKKGQNATKLAQDLKQKLILRTSSADFDPEIKFQITRDYGATAKEKSEELLKHLLIATFSVMFLIALFMGWRVALVVGVAVPVTLAMTLFIYYLMGYTLNRVTLFALIFSIGILVDDAIVVVENIYRHLSLGIHKAKDLAITIATDEVGNPTILATLTVIVAIMPMAFVGGMMGPYMRPIPIGASMAMIFSLFIAFIVSPWASKRLIQSGVHDENPKEGLISKIFRPAMGWMMASKKHTFLVLGFVFVLLIGSIGLMIGKVVKVKMLPFDNKSEFQILVDLPPGATLDDTSKVVQSMTEQLYTYKDVQDVQSYVGTAAPFNFSGMVKHTFQRASSFKADIQVNLLDKNERKIQSHELIRGIRTDFNKLFSNIPGIKIKFLEIPPGPPVMSTLLGEVYHQDPQTQEKSTQELTEIYKSTDGVVEVDNSIDPQQNKIFYKFNREKGMLLGVPQSYTSNTLLMAMGDLNLFPLHQEKEEEPVFMRLSLPSSAKVSDEALLSLLVPSVEGDKIPLKRVIDIEAQKTRNPIYHKDLKNVSYVMAEVSGSEESPFYAITNMSSKLSNFEVTYSDVQNLKERPILKWDGEMDITVEVFRDLGIAFLIAVILILIIVIGWYNSFSIPFIIILPI